MTTSASTSPAVQKGIRTMPFDASASQGTISVPREAVMLIADAVNPELKAQIAELEAERSQQNDEIAKLKSECEELKQKALTEKTKNQSLQELLINIVNQSNAGDARKQNVCDMIEAYINGAGLIKSRRKHQRAMRSENNPNTPLTFELTLPPKEQNQALAKASSDAVEFKLISADTQQSDFWEIFSGRNTNAQIKWIAGPGALNYFIKQLKARNAIKKPAGPGIWQITASHFIDAKGHPFTCNLSAQHCPKNKEVVANINDVVNVMQYGY